MHLVANNPIIVDRSLPHYDMRDLRKIRAELASIKEEILHSDPDDPITKDITLWFDTYNEYFHKTVREDHDLKPVIESQTKLMKRLLDTLDPNLKGHRLVTFMKRWVDDQVKIEIPDLEEEILQMMRKGRRSERRERKEDLDARLKDFENKLRHKVNAELKIHENSVLQVFRDQNQLLNKIEDKINDVIHDQSGRQTEIKDLGDAVLHVIRRSRRSERRERNENRETRLKDFERQQQEKIAAEMARHEEALKKVAEEQTAHLSEVEGKVNFLIHEQFEKAEEIQDAIKLGENELKRLDHSLNELEEKKKTLNLKTDALEIAKTNLEIGVNRLQTKIAEKENERNHNLLQTILMTAACIALKELAPELIPLLLS